MKSVSEEEVVEALKNVMDPELRRCLVDLGMVKAVKIRDGNVCVTISLTLRECPMKADIKRAVENRLRGLPGVKRVDVDITAMTKKERRRLFEELIAEAGSEPHIAAGLIAE